MATDETTRPAHSPPWMFAFPYLAYGIVGGFQGTAMPFLVRTRAHVEMDSIGWFAFITMLPPIFQFLYAPVVDVGLRRRSWLLLVSILGAACLCAACLMPLPERLYSFLGFVVAAQALTGLIGSCTGGMLAATMPDDKRGKAGGWLNTGNLVGAAIGGSIATFMTQRGFAPLTLGLTVATLVVLPTLVALLIIDGPRIQKPARQAFGTMAGDVAKVLRSRAGWTGILFCMSPVGSAALVNLFGGMTPDFHLSDLDPTVVWVNGVAGAGLSAIGSLAGGYLCDRVSRRGAYLVSGILTAVCVFAMAAFPLNKTNYIIGVSAYLLVAGLCYAAFSAVVLETIGRAGEAASAQYTLFSSAGNVAIAYVGKLDTVFSSRFGGKAPLVTDGALNLLGVALLGAVLYLVRVRRPTREVVSSTG